jgi:hypothetical protein
LGARSLPWHNTQPDEPALEFRWSADKDALLASKKGSARKSVSLSDLTEVNVASADDKTIKWYVPIPEIVAMGLLHCSAVMCKRLTVQSASRNATLCLTTHCISHAPHHSAARAPRHQRPYPFSADLSTCFSLRTAKRAFHWAAFPAGKATAVRAKLSIELLKRQQGADDSDKRPRAATMRSLSEAVRHDAGRSAVLKTRGWHAAVAAAATDSSMDEVATEVIASLKVKRGLLENAGVAR